MRRAGTTPWTTRYHMYVLMTIAEKTDTRESDLSFDRTALTRESAMPCRVLPFESLER